MGRLAAEHLLPGEGHDIELWPVERLREGGRGRVADRQPLAIIRDPARVNDAHARRRAVPGEDDVAGFRVDLLQVRQLAIRRLEEADIGQLELFCDIGHPAGAKALPGEHVDAAGPEQRPHRHLDGAGVGSGHDADAVIRRHLQHLAGQVDRSFELVLADLGAVRAAERCVGEIFEGPAGALGAGAGREMRHARTRGRNSIRHRCLHPYRWARHGGVACPGAGRRMGGVGEFKRVCPNSLSAGNPSPGWERGGVRARRLIAGARLRRCALWFTGLPSSGAPRHLLPSGRRKRRRGSGSGESRGEPLSRMGEGQG